MLETDLETHGYVRRLPESPGYHTRINEKYIGFYKDFVLEYSGK